MRNNNIHNTFLYELLLNDISILVKYSINEAYDNALLEEYNAKQFIDKILDYSLKGTIIAAKGAAKGTLMTIKAIDDANIPEKTKKAYLITRKIIVKILEDIKNSQGYAKVKEFLKYLKNEIIKTIKKHNTLTIKLLLWDIKVSLLALGMFGAGYLASIINSAKNEIDDLDKDNTEVVSDIEHDDKELNDIPVLKTQNLKNAISPEFGIAPVDYVKTLDKSDSYMEPSKNCKDFIKNDEVLCKIPYFATNIEKNAGLITIGYGHIICDNWKDPKCTWYFPDGISEHRKLEIKRNILNYAKHNMILLSKVELAGNGYKNGNVDPRAKDIITNKEANIFFENDLKIADRRVRIMLGIAKGGNPAYDKNREINGNVKYYCYYNLKIYDTLLSCVFNTGAFKAEVPFIQSLLNCRYDYNTNAINQSDFDLTFKKFKKGNGRNLDRREKEYNTFIKSTLDTLENFKNLINK